jgi:transposase
MKSYQYRIYPNKEQTNILNKTLELCRNLYNTALYQRITGYKLGYKVSFYTQSKRCSNCGYVNDQLELKDRTYNCPNCGISLDRDYNASKNILWLGSSLISGYLS